MALEEVEQNIFNHIFEPLCSNRNVPALQPLHRIDSYCVSALYIFHMLRHNINQVDDLSCQDYAYK